jgi:hypothetical protein
MTTRPYEPDPKPLTGWQLCLMGAAGGAMFTLLFALGLMLG